MNHSQPRSVRGRSALICVAHLLCVLRFAAIGSAQDQQPDLTQLSLEQLSKVEVTSVSKKQQKLSDTAAAVYVITQHDIRNSTATSIPQLLRDVPGVDVSQINGSTWAISVRGFAEQYTGKMLVLIDGRIAFDPLISGVVWADNDIELQDIDRIEVIRGPGATVWGANAFNGVINIITKPAHETQGMLVSSGIGEDERTYDLLRYGGALGKKSAYRAYTKYFDDGPSGTFNGLPAHDSWRNISGGFRIDTKLSDRDSLVWEGQGYRGQGGKETTDPSFTPPFTRTFVGFMGHGGENLMGRWIHKSLSGAETTAQASFGHILHPEVGLDVSGNVMSASIQHERAMGSRHDLVFGADVIFRSAHTLSHDGVVWWNPADPSFTVSGGFVQDEVLLANGTVHLTGGLRVQHNSFSGVDLQPNARVLWKITPAQALWFAYSRANRSPSPADTAINSEIAIFPGPGGLRELRLTGNPNINSESVNAFETGYRIQVSKKISVDTTAFYNGYSGLVGQAPGQPFFDAGPPPRLVLPLVSQNNQSGKTYGAELAAHWTPNQRLRFDTAYSYISFDLARQRATGSSPVRIWSEPPRHKLTLGPSIGMGHGFTLNSKLNFIDRRVAQNLPGFTQVDSSLVWRPSDSGEFRIGADNIFNKEHVEFLSQQGANSTTLGRSIYGRVIWHFGQVKTR